MPTQLAAAAPEDGRGRVREAQLTEALGQCLRQMKVLTVRMADLETKLAASPASYSVPVVGAGSLAPPVAPTLVPPAAIAPAGAFPNRVVPTPIPATLPPKGVMAR